jgi:hypothetical protein
VALDKHRADDKRLQKRGGSADADFFFLAAFTGAQVALDKHRADAERLRQRGSADAALVSWLHQGETDICGGEGGVQNLAGASMMHTK